MKGKHTPGEWKHKDGSLIIFDEHGGEIADCGVRFICVLADRDERDANVRLISATPDLLAVLESVEWWLVPAVPGIGAMWECPWCKRRKIDGHADDCPRQAAIAKATGDDG